MAEAIGSIVGGIGSADQEGKASDAQRSAAGYKAKANETMNRINKVNAQRQREMDIQQTRQASANILTNEANSGVKSSSAEGSLFSVATQLKSNIGFGNEIQGLQDQYAEYENQAIYAGSEASEHESRARQYQAFSGIGKGVDSFFSL